MREQIQN